MIRMKDDQFPGMKDSVETYMRLRMMYMKSESLFRTDVVSKAARDICMELIAQLAKLLEPDINMEVKQGINEKIQSIKKFKVHSAWQLL